MIESETERLSAIVNQILLAGQLESGRVSLVEREFDLGRARRRRRLDAARVTAPETVELRGRGRTATASALRGDEDKLRQVLVNLDRERGQVLARRRHGHGRPQRARTAARGSRCATCGLGIPESDHERVFEKFTRLDPGLSRGVGGTGLGLYIARELVERMGGEIAVDSALGTGSTFAVELPTSLRRGERRA